MTFILILLGLIVVLMTGVPVFAGLTLFGAALIYFDEGQLGGLGDLVFAELDTYLLVAIPPGAIGWPDS
jgi:C4-dicarboxylate transporter, DctM subunit